MLGNPRNSLASNLEILNMLGTLDDQLQPSYNLVPVFRSRETLCTSITHHYADDRELCISPFVPLLSRYFKAMQASSKVCPYITAEVSRWHPAPPEDPKPLPPTLALGGAEDKVIRPFQVSAAAERWGAKVVVLEGVTHDVMLGPQAELVTSHLLSWLDTVPMAVTAGAAAAANVHSSQQQVETWQSGGGTVTSVASSSSGMGGVGDRRGSSGGSSGSRGRVDASVFSRNGPDPPAAFS